jgi:hypothetical protein
MFFQFFFSISVNPFTFAARPGGEIGRRTVFRSQHPQGCAGSNPVPGTKVSLSKTKGLFYLYAGELVRQSGQIKKIPPAKQDETFG